MAAALLLLGALCLVVGVSLITWPAGLATFGLLLMAAGVDTARS